ncbi:MAG: GNAT family N-acetyltransferase [Nitrososphaeria archaeon]
MITIKIAGKKEIQILSKKLLSLLEDKNSQIYHENVTKFGIPEEYVKKAFAEDTLLKAILKGKSTFYLVLDEGEIIGFAQIIQHDTKTVELDRIIIFPKYAGRGIGTQLLQKIIQQQEQKGVNNIIVKTGKEEKRARQFYEKNSFKQLGEETVDTPWGKRLTIVIYQLHLNE